MKAFKLVGWPDLPLTYRRTAYRRMLNEMSHRPVSVQQLMGCSGVPMLEVQSFLRMLSRRGVLRVQDGSAEAASWSRRLRSHVRGAWVSLRWNVAQSLQTSRLCRRLFCESSSLPPNR